MESFLFSVLTGVFGIISILLALFSMWKKLYAEHIDMIDKLFDILFLSVVGAMAIGRLAYVFSHFSQFGLSLSKWLSPTTFATIGTVVLVSGIYIFWFLMKDLWRDRIEILDYLSIPLSVFLSISATCSLILDSIILFVFTSQQTVSWLTLVLDLIQIVVFGALVIGLSKLERTYRTFLWYRYRRSSAQSGFVIAMFLIIYGLWGSIAGWFYPPVLAINGISIEPIMSMIVVVIGFCMIYIRSGRLNITKSKS